MELRLAQAGLPVLLMGRHLVPAGRRLLRAGRLFVPVSVRRCRGLLALRAGGPLASAEGCWASAGGRWAGTAGGLAAGTAAGPGWAGSVRLFPGLLRHPAWPGRGDGRERLRRGLRLPEVRPHGHPRHGCARRGGRPGPVARAIRAIVPVRQLLHGSPLGGHQRRRGRRGDGGPGPDGDIRPGRDLGPGRGYLRAGRRRPTGSPPPPLSRLMWPPGRPELAPLAVGCTKEGSMAGRAICAGGSGPLFAPGTRRGRGARLPGGRPPVAALLLRRVGSGGGASSSP